MDWKGFISSMLIFLAFFTIIAIAMLVTGTWGFDIVLVIFYGGGLLISGVINTVKYLK